MGKYDTKLGTQRDDMFTPGEHYIVVTECGISPSMNPSKRHVNNYRLGGRVLSSRGAVANLTFKDHTEQKTFPPLPVGSKAADFCASDNVLYAPETLGKFTRAIMDSLHLTATGPESPVRTALLAAMGKTFTPRHFSEASLRYKKQTLKDEWNDEKSAEENKNAWVDVEQYFVSGQGKNLILRVEGKGAVTQKNQAVITKVYIHGVDQAEWYDLIDGKLTAKFSEA